MELDLLRFQYHAENFARNSLIFNLASPPSLGMRLQEAGSQVTYVIRIMKDIAWSIFCFSFPFYEIIEGSFL